MTKSINQLVASKVFHHFIVAVIVLAGVAVSTFAAGRQRRPSDRAGDGPDQAAADPVHGGQRLGRVGAGALSSPAHPLSAALIRPRSGHGVC